MISLIREPDHYDSTLSTFDQEEYLKGVAGGKNMASQGYLTNAQLANWLAICTSTSMCAQPSWLLGLSEGAWGTHKDPILPTRGAFICMVLPCYSVQSLIWKRSFNKTTVSWAQLSNETWTMTHCWCADEALMMHWWYADDALMMRWWCTDDTLTIHR